MKEKVKITKAAFDKIHKDFKSVWSSDHIHGTNYNGKRTMLYNDNGSTVLLIEGVGFEVVN